MIDFLKKALRFSVGVAALPLVIPASRAFFSEVSNISFAGEPGQSYFLWGVVAYAVLHLFFHKPRYAYNLGHESVHAVSAWLSFGKAKNIKVSSEGGSIQTTKSNFFINLSPYFVPIYTILAALAYFGLSKITETTNYTPYFIFAVGFTMAMHIIMTVEALKTAQPDLLRTGYLFSLAVIYVLNIAVTAFVISLVFTGFSFTEMALQFCAETRTLYAAIFSQLFAVR
jgi:hypothetical protein